MFSRGEADLGASTQREDKQALSMEQLPTPPHKADMCICTKHVSLAWNNPSKRMRETKEKRKGVLLVKPGEKLELSAA